jgi:hypothetical protein
MVYTCKVCNKIYSSYQSLWRHNKSKHIQNSSNITTSISQLQIVSQQSSIQSSIVSQPDISQQPNQKTYKCKHCNKIYYNRNSKYKHQKLCKKEMIDMITLSNKIDKIEKKLDTSNNTINTKITNKINNGTINHITINGIGNELLDSLSNNDISKIFSKEIESIFTFIELINFNVLLPENHNHCVTNLESKYLSKYNSNTKKIEKDRKKYFFDALLSKSIDRIQILYNNNKHKFSEKKQNNISNTIETLHLFH